MSTELKTYEVLERALRLIEREEDWTCGNSGMDGGPKVCAEGAVGRVLGIGGREYPVIQRTAASLALASQLPPGCVIGGRPLVWFFNDHHTHAEVVALFQTAIRAEKQKAGIPLNLPTSKPLTKVPA